MDLFDGRVFMGFHATGHAQVFGATTGTRFILGWRSTVTGIVVVFGSGHVWRPDMVWIWRNGKGMLMISCLW